MSSPATTPIFRIPSFEDPVGIESALESVLPCDDLLYHFTTLETGLEKILPNRSLRFAPLAGTSDPLEFEDIYHVGIDLGFGIETDDVLRHGSRVRDLRKRAGLVCFCSEKYDPEQPFLKGWKRARMWAQYAGFHRGICLVFHKARLESAVRSALPNRWELLTDPIGYCDEYVIGSGIMSATTLRPGDAVKESAQARLVREAKFLLYSKLNDFRDECEWRMVLVPDKDSSDSEHLVPVLDSLQAVILGTKFPDVYEDAILNCCRCDVFRVSWFHGRGHLDRVTRQARQSPNTIDEEKPT